MANELEKTIEELEAEVLTELEVQSSDVLQKDNHLWNLN